MGLIKTHLDGVPMLFLLCFLLILPPSDQAYIIIMNNNKKMKVRSAPVCQGRFCKVTLINGEVTTLPSKLINHEKTREYNKQMIEKRQQKIAEDAALAKQKLAEEKKKREQMRSITDSKKLPRYDRTTGTAGTLVGPDVSGEPTGEPIVKTYVSEDPVYVILERMIPYEDKTIIQVTIKTNIATGIHSANIDIKIHFEDGTIREYSQSTGPIEYNKTEELVFNADATGGIVQTAYNIKYEVVAN